MAHTGAVRQSKDGRAGTSELDPELEAGLRRLRLRGMCEVAPDLPQTVKTQCWAPAELLVKLEREEIAAREASNERARLKAAGFPAHTTRGSTRRHVRAQRG